MAVFILFPQYEIPHFSEKNGTPFPVCHLQQFSQIHLTREGRVESPSQGDEDMKMHSLDDLFVEQLRDLYDAEKQLVKALPKMAKAASAKELQTAFEDHLKQTEGHVERLERIFDLLGKKQRGKTCEAMVGLIKEGGEMIDANAEASVRDAGLIAAAQRVEHYEMAGYGCLRTWARQLNHQNAADLIEQTFQEEKEADCKLTQIAESSVNNMAAQHQMQGA
jgi:ferritin-like metal-binding protein YciE